MKLVKIIKLLSVLISIALLFGCAFGAKTEKMVYNSYESNLNSFDEFL